MYLATFELHLFFVELIFNDVGVVSLVLAKCLIISIIEVSVLGRDAHSEIALAVILIAVYHIAVHVV